MCRITRIFAVVMLLFSATACQAVSTGFEQDISVAVTPEEVKLRTALIQEIKAFEAKLGWRPTDNFLEYSEALGTYDFCGRAERLSFIVRWDTSTKEECEKDGRTYDTAYYELEALAGIGTPLSGSLVKAELSRFIMVVFHEDFHEQIRKIPALALNESATQLMGFLAAREFVREKYGKHSDIARAFAQEAELSLNDARIEKRYYQELKNLYDRVSSGEVDEVQGLKREAFLYGEMQRECKETKLTTASSCGEITNNVIFASSILYAMHYPLFYDLHKTCGGDVKRTGLIIIRLVDEDLGEEEFVRRTEELIVKGCTAVGASLF